MGIRLQPVGNGFSFFGFIQQYSMEERSGATVTRTLHRLCTLMRKMDVESLVVEELAPSAPEIYEECEALNTYFDRKLNITAFRFTFIGQQIGSLDALPTVEKDLFLSSAILINFEQPEENEWHTYLYNAIVSIPGKFGYDEAKTKIKKPLLNNYLHAKGKFHCKIEISEKETFEFEIEGTYFCQQNIYTSVCAHAALCMTINSMSRNADLISTERINKLIGIDHKKTKISQGLSADQIQQVLKATGLSCTLWDFFRNPNYEYSEYIYRYLEGRCPVLLGFSTERLTLHVVPVFGHTLNSDMWKPEAEWAYAEGPNRLSYKSAASWVDHFIVHDDNFGMYLCLPVDSLKKATPPKDDPKFRAYSAVVITPEHVTTSAWEAEYASMVVTRDQLEKALAAGGIDDWSSRILDLDRLVVVRTLLSTKSHYSRSLNDLDFEGNALTESDKILLLENLPESFWLSEITLPDLYSANRTKIVDFFYPSNLPQLGNLDQIFERWIQLRFPHVLVVRNQIFKQISTCTHYPLFTFNEPGNTFDW